CSHLINSGREAVKYLFVEFYNRGSAYMRRGDFERAVYDYSEAIGFSPGDSDSYVSRGRAFDAIGDEDQAIENFTHAIALDPNNAAAFHHRGNAWFHKND